MSKNCVYVIAALSVLLNGVVAGYIMRPYLLFSSTPAQVLKSIGYGLVNGFVIALPFFGIVVCTVALLLWALSLLRKLVDKIQADHSEAQRLHDELTSTTRR